MIIITSISDLGKKLQEKIKLADKKSNEYAGYEANSISKYVEDLISLNPVEVGYRAQCGSTHGTQKTYREFIKVIQALEKEGFEISQERVKHKNAYATNNGGFWQSIIFKLI